MRADNYARYHNPSCDGQALTIVNCVIRSASPQMSRGHDVLHNVALWLHSLCTEEK